MIADETLAAFEATNMGWLTDGGDLVVCGLHEHMAALAKVPRFREAHERYRETCEANAAWMQSELDDLADDEHPSMHRFDGMDDDAKAELVKAVYSAGWVRVGRALDLDVVSRYLGGDRPAGYDVRKDPGNWYVEAEGLTDHVRAGRRALDRIAKGLGCPLRLREMKYVMYGRGRSRGELLVPEAYVEDVKPRNARRG